MNIPKNPPMIVVIENTSEKEVFVHPNSCIVNMGKSVSMNPNIIPVAKTPTLKMTLDFKLTTL